MNTVLKIFNYRFYVKEFLLLFFTFFLMEGIFSWLFIHNSIIIEGYQKVLSIFIYGFILFRFNHLKRGERIFVGLFTLVMIKLVLESLTKYDTLFRQLTMFTVLFPVIFTLFIKYVIRSMEIDLLEFMAKFYIITYLVFMVLFGRGFSFSLESVDMEDYGPFSGDTRIIHASHIFMMIVPLLWFLNEFIKTKKNKFLFPFLLCLVLILVHQHRSVWSSALVALFFYFMAMVRNRTLKISGLWGVLIGAGGLMLLAYFFVSNLFPGFIDFLSSRFSEILDPSKEGSTGNFRIEQRQVYFNLFLQRPIFGWTFEGFEMQNPLVDWWPEMTGQHFHEGYIEMLFYQGIVGLLLKFSFLIYLLVKIFSKRLSSQSIILTAFGISGLIFSFNYVLPLIFWGHVGMCLYYLEKDLTPTDHEKIEEEAEYSLPKTDTICYPRSIGTEV